MRIVMLRGCLCCVFIFLMILLIPVHSWDLSVWTERGASRLARDQTLGSSVQIRPPCDNIPLPFSYRSMRNPCRDSVEFWQLKVSGT